MSKTTDFTDPVVATILAVLVMLVVGLLFIWPAMLMFGVVHSFWPFLPAFGFWQTFAVMVLARFLGSASTRPGS